MSTPTYRRPLNANQLQILFALYKFRFGTTDLLLSTQNKSITRQYINTRLRILCEQEYIARRHNNSYKLDATFASYYLLPKGIEVLKQYPEHFKPQILKNLKNDYKASSRFIRHSLSIFAVYAHLKELYGNTFKFYTRSYLSLPQFDHMPEKRPDAYTIGTYGTNDTKQYLIECFDDTMPHSIMLQKIKRLTDHADSGGWPETKPYPLLLFVCQTERLQKHVQRWASKAIADGWANDLQAMVVLLDDINLCS